MNKVISQCSAIFVEQLQHKISLSQQEDKKFTLLLIEIVNSSALKVIYDQIFIEQIISDITQEILTSLDFHKQPYDIIDHEYIILVADFIDTETLEDYTYKIHNNMQFYRSSDENKPVHLVSTISSVMLDKEIKDAQQAMSMVYLTSKNGNFDENKFHHSYSELEERKNNFKNHFILSDCLKKALIEKKIRLAYQPIIDSRDGKISHYECLLRMINEEGKIISAGPFIPIVESMGFINLIDEIVLEMVINELTYSKDVIFTFNLSSIGVHNKSWLKKIQQLVSHTSLASRLIVEITETAAHKDLGKAAHFIATLQDMGCLVALDDFGSGHTSFHQLKILPIDIVKIDGSFIKDIIGNKENQLFVKTLIAMSKVFGLKSVAEFVENGEIAKLLIDFEVDYMQGNYFCPAVNYRSWNYENTQ
jgi:EAL domain-containing protein (putative c-di-GMP-specific phosphodiesterase class I)